MNENRGNHKTSANHVSPAPGEVEIVQPRQGIWRTYDVADGLPTGIQRGLQDRRGYLWLTSWIESVACRFDGTEFTMYTTNDGLANGGVASVLGDSQGRLWFGTVSGVSCFDGQRFITYTTDDGLANNHVRAICEDSQGRLWFGTVSGVSCFDGQRFINYTTDDGLVNNFVQAICEDSQGRLWFGTHNGVSCFDGQRFTNYTTDDGLAGNHVRAICEDSQGYLWFGMRYGGVSRFDGRRLSACDIEGLTGDKSVVTICEDRQGRLWFGAFGCGVFCFDGQRFINYTTEDGLLENRVWGIIQDREGHFWICHHQSGLTYLDLETLQTLTTESVTDALIQDSEGRLWFGSENHLCCLFRGQQRRRAFNSLVSTLMQDSAGALWVGTWMDGLYCYDPPDAVWSGEGKHFKAEDGLGSNEIWGLLEARNGTIWVGTGAPGCLCRFNPACGVPGKAFGAIPTPHPVISCLFEDSRGRIWMGGWIRGGLSCYDGEKLVTYTRADGLPTAKVISIVEDDDGNLWIGTYQGLCCFDGKRFTTYGREQGLLCRVYSNSSAKDGTGQLWFGTQGGGVYRYDGKHFQWLTTEDGLPTSTVTGLIPQPDGSMIIGTRGGIVHYHPTATLPPPVEIREVVADQIYRNTMELELTTTDARLLTISYHGLSFATRRMRYSYILEGCDKEWQDTWDSQVRYENLPVGEYTFKVIAINRDLVPSETSATLKLRVVPDPRDLMVSELESDLRARSQQLAFLQREMGRKYHFENIVGDSDAMEWVRAMMERAIDSGLNVLITGETGTGKELVAKAIHYNSPRKGHPLLDRNCGAIPKELLASDLFGHRKGAFTGAQEDKVGLFEAAEGGTVLLDEISEMPLDAQIHLLRVLEERKVQRLGENVSRDVDVRIIAMTNKDLMEEGKAGRFREDLYYRLSEFPIPIPPLRERPEDIPLLAEHFLEEYSQEQKKELNGFEPGVLEMLQSYSWPGNVRELRNDVRRAAALVEEGERIHIHHFPPRIIQEILPLQEAMQTIGQKSTRYRELVDDFERRCIEHALRVCAGNRSQAAKMLGLGRKSLYEKMQRLGIG